MPVAAWQQNEEMDRLAILRTYMGNATIRETMDKTIGPSGS